MLKNYFLIAIRNFFKNWVFSLINIGGLAIGISAALVIYLIVHHEFSYDTFHKDRDRIYRVVSNMHFPDQEYKNGGVPGPLYPAVRAEMPGIEKSAYFWDMSDIKVSIPARNGNEQVFKRQSQVIFTDQDYFRFFDYEWLAGSPDKSLDAPNKVVLSESRARTYFPFSDITLAVGQTILYEDTVSATVTGIVKDITTTTDFTFKEFISLPTFTQRLKAENGWGEWGSISSASQFFVKLAKGTDTASINKALVVLRKKHEKNAYLSTDHFLQPLSDIHFSAEFDAFDHRQGHKPTLYGLLAVAAFLLLLGCINFINLTTAQAAQRAKEIGIRKTMGSSRRQLVIQFIGETVLLTTVATIISVALIPTILKLFSPYIPEGIQFNLFQQPHILVFIASLVIVVSLLSGFYPAMILSGYKPVQVLKNVTRDNSSKTRRVWVRKTLTVSQFVIAQFLIIATLVVGKQIRFTLNKDMGFSKEAIVNFRIPYTVDGPDGRQKVLLEKLKKIPGIQQLSLAGSPPATQGVNFSTMKFNKDGKEIETTVEDKRADDKYFDLYKIKLVAGRNLQPSDTLREFVINETYAKFLGYNDPRDIIGKAIDRSGRLVPIVGVIKDINTKPLHQAIQPLAFSSQAQSDHTFHVALPPNQANSDGWKSTLASIEKAWKELYPEEPFNYTFFDESIARFYEKEQQTANLLHWCAGLAIFISCLGLLGLVIFTTIQRTKEIGVRKVLGASVPQIVTLLSKDFLQLVFLAFVIAAPIAWWAMHKWLEDYAYRTTISWWVFVLSGLVMLAIAILTLSIQTIRSAIANPVKSLRTE